MNTFNKQVSIFWLALAVSSTAVAHGEKGNLNKHGEQAAKKEQKDWGIAGDAKSVTRTIRLTMGDQMRFSPDKLEIAQGQTVKFVVANKGALVHEFVIGTQKENDVHAALMVKHPGMEHDEPYMTHVSAGKTGEVIWTFNRAGDFHFACLINGHYQAGMVGTIKVSAPKSHSQSSNKH